MRLPRVHLSRILLVFGLTMAITAGAAFAKGGPRIVVAMATFHLDIVRDRPVQCEGQDGSYVEEVIHYRGTQTSSTPALNGTARATIHTLVNIFTGVGANFGRITIRNQDSGKVTSEGFFVGAIKDFENKGLEVSRLITREALIANFSARIAPDSGHVEGEFGANPAMVASDLAVVWNLQGCGQSSFWRDYQAALASVAR